MKHFKFQNNSIWVSKKEHENIQKFYDKLQSKMFHTGYGMSSDYLKIKVIRDSQKLPENRWKIAIIKIGNTTKMAWVDSLNENAWKCGEHYSKTWMQIKKYTFIRWARSMDI